LINNEIISIITETTNALIGFANLESRPKEVRQNFKHGIVIALPYSNEAMASSQSTPSIQHRGEYITLNETIPKLITKVAEYLIQNNYKALPLIRHNIVVDQDLRTILPYKTVATLAGIGWIGKCATLVTHEYGSAVRLGIILTNAPLECGTPITKSQCPAGCNICVNICPGNAPKGMLWEAGIDRDEFFDARACYKAANKIITPGLPPGSTFCGLCIANCPLTKKGLGYQ